MQTSSERSHSEKLNTWVQIAGISVATIWGAYTFIYKEILVPKSAPVNISLNLQLKKIGRSASEAKEENKALVGVEMQVSATNPSTRDVYLFPNTWVAYGYKCREVSDYSKFVERANSALSSGGLDLAQKHAEITQSNIVAVGRLFTDDILRPSETIARKLIFYVPVGQYDCIEVSALMPSAVKKEGIEWEQKFSEDYSSYRNIVYRVSKNGQREEVKPDKNGILPKDLGLQMQNSTSTLSLWQ